jgi:hypothetical protein
MCALRFVLGDCLLYLLPCVPPAPAPCSPRVLRRRYFAFSASQQREEQSASTELKFLHTPSLFFSLSPFPCIRLQFFSDMNFKASPSGADRKMSNADDDVSAPRPRAISTPNVDMGGGGGSGQLSTRRSVDLASFAEEPDEQAVGAPATSKPSSTTTSSSSSSGGGFFSPIAYLKRKFKEHSAEHQAKQEVLKQVREPTVLLSCSLVCLESKFLLSLCRLTAALARAGQGSPRNAREGRERRARTEKAGVAAEPKPRHFLRWRQATAQSAAAPTDRDAQTHHSRSRTPRGWFSRNHRMRLATPISFLVQMVRLVCASKFLCFCDSHSHLFFEFNILHA